MTNEALSNGHFTGNKKKTEINGENKLQTPFLSPAGSWSRRFPDAGLKASLDGGVKTGSGNLMHFLVYSFSVSGDGVGFSSKHSECPIQQLE